MFDAGARARLPQQLRTPGPRAPQSHGRSALRGSPRRRPRLQLVGPSHRQPLDLHPRARPVAARPSATAQRTVSLAAQDRRPAVATRRRAASTETPVTPLLPLALNKGPEETVALTVLI